MTLRALLKPSLNWMLIFLPLAAWQEYIGHNHTLTFIFSCLAVIPLAGWMGTATEHLAERTGDGVGGLINATFGNAAELIIALVALNQGPAMYDVVKASITGSIIGNILLVTGAACLAGGVRYRVLRFNASAVRSYSSMLFLAAVALIAPAVFHWTGGEAVRAQERNLSLEISFVLIITYILSLFFSLKTHRDLFSGSEVAAAAEEKGPTKHEPWPISKAIGLLVLATALIAIVAEWLVGSVTHAAHDLGMNSIFVGVIVVAIVGNAAEHSTAIIVARNNRMDLALGIAIGSSIQIALFVAPALVFASYLFNPSEPLDLVFAPLEVVAIVISIFVVEQIVGDGETHWLEGVQLLSVYIILALMFYLVPMAASAPA